MENYPDEAIEKLCAYINDDENAGKWLKENNFRELYEFWDAYENEEESFQWLKNNGFTHLAACIDTMNDNSKAKLWLIKFGYSDLAVFCDASQGSQQAVSILLKNQNHHLVKVAKTIFMHQKKKKKSFWRIFDFGNPFR